MYFSFIHPPNFQRAKTQGVNIIKKHNGILSAFIMDLGEPQRSHA